MTESAATPMLHAPSFDEARTLREFFHKAGYTEQGLLERFGISQPPAPQVRRTPRIWYETQPPDPLNVLARWFLLGLPAHRAAVQAALPGWLVDICQRTGLVIDCDEIWRPTAVISPAKHLLVASDTFQQLASPSGAEHVLSINPSTELLLNCTIREPVGATLDLCGGSGIQGLAATSHSERVVSADLNPRATNYAAFNARLNGCRNMECVTGDSYAPVVGQRFDLITCNPPFVVLPGKEYTYRDTDMVLDAFCRKLVREAPAYLNPGGYFQMIGEWVEVEGQAWSDRISAWFEDTGCDVWVLKDHTQKPSLYAEARLRETIPISGERDMDTFDEWMRYYREQAVEAIHGGVVVMRRRAGANRLRIEEFPGSIGHYFGNAIHQGFLTQDFLEEQSADAEFMNTKPRLASNVRLYHEREWERGHWTVQPLRLAQTSGLHRQIGVDGPVADLLVKFDGEHTVREAVANLTLKAQAEPAQLEKESLQVVQHMLDLGFLVP